MVLEDEAITFDCTSCMTEYGLQRAPALHMQRTQQLRDHAIRAEKKAADNETFVAGDYVMKFGNSGFSDSSDLTVSEIWVSCLAHTLRGTSAGTEML